MPSRRAEHLAALTAAKAVLDGQRLSPTPVRIDRVRIVRAPWLLRLPWFRRFDGYGAWSLILLRRDPESDPALLVHELCHVWQMQHHPIRMPLSYISSGYRRNRFELEARKAMRTALPGRENPTRRNVP